MHVREYESKFIYLQFNWKPALKGHKPCNTIGKHFVFFQ